MKALFRPFRRLQWKLTFSYTWITLATVGMLTLAGSIAGIEAAAANFSQLAIGDLQTHAPELVPYLAATPPDKAGVERWLRQSANLTTQVVVSESPYIAYSVSMDGFTAVVDHDGVVVASRGSGATPAGALLESHLPQQATAALRAALGGQTDAHRLVAQLADGTAIVAYPLVGPYGRIEGALVGQTTDLSQPQILFKAFLVPLILTIPVAILTALIGTLFGFFMARGFYRRIRRLSLTVDQWGQGIFTVLAKDASGDELGQLTRRLNRLAAQFQGLLHARQQLATLEERQRLARDLHDSVKQQIFAISMLVNSTRELLSSDLARARTCLDETDAYVQQVQQELTALVQALRPTALEEQGLVAAVCELAAQWSHRSGITAQVKVQGNPTPSLIVEETLFRIAQEALANVARHSRAARVEIILAGEQDTCTLKVDDNGQGFDQTTVQRRGIGLLSMQERIHAVGGMLLVESAPGTGTRITACCPDPGARAVEQAGTQWSRLPSSSSMIMPL